MSTAGGARTAPGKRSVTVLLLITVAVLLVGVLLVRPGTAATEADLAPAPAPAPASSVEKAEPVPAVADIAAESIFGLTLGETVSDLQQGGYRLGAGIGGCTPVVPGPGPSGRSPGPGLTAWAVDGRLASVALDTSSGSTSSLAGLLGRSITELALSPLALPGVATGQPGVTAVEVGWDAAPVAVPVVTLTAALPATVGSSASGSSRSSASGSSGTDAAVVLAADVRGNGTVDHVELSTPAAQRCDAALRAGAVDTTPLGYAGRGAVVLNMDEAALRQVVAVSPADGSVVRLDPGTGELLRRCRTLLVHDPPGLASVLLADGKVQAVAVDGGATAAGLRVGDDAAAVTRAYPDITTAHVEDRWQQGLAVDWEFPEGRLRIFGGPRRVPVPGLDAEVVGPGFVVVRVEVGGRC